MFTFKKFTIIQDKCAMKVGTDGVLLGAWAASGMEATRVEKVLDIGTGTGLIALMMAQRLPHASVTGIDIDKDAAKQAMENVESSPFSQNINILHKSLQEFVEEQNSEYCDAGNKLTFDAIVCNPPYFDNSLTCPDPKRTTARHNSTLPFCTLMQGAKILLADEGCFSLVIPSEYRQKIEDEAIFSGMTLAKRTAVITKKGKKPKRYLLEFCHWRRPFEERVLSLESDEYRLLTADFYLSKP